MDKNNHLINLSDICMTEYDDKERCFKVTLKDNSEHEVKELPYNLSYKTGDTYEYKYYPTLMNGSQILRQINKLTQGDEKNVSSR